MQFIKGTLKIDFMGKRQLAFIASAILLVVSVVSLATRSLNFGIDFTGGYLIEIGYEQPAELDSIRKLLAGNGFDGAVVQHFGSSKDVLVRLLPKGGIEDMKQTAEVGDQILSILQQGDASASMRRVEFVGPQVGDELKNDGGIAMLIALGFILLYIMIRFEKRFGIGAVLALVHDVIITLGVFSVLQADFDLTVLAALLAVIGYSLNDTIVVFDRIRENFSRMRKAETKEIINVSTNQTLDRTLMTSGTTLLVLFALFFLGGETVHGFALALIVGIVVGTYSSIFIASAFLLALGLTRDDLLQHKKEGEEISNMP